MDLKAKAGAVLVGAALAIGGLSISAHADTNVQASNGCDHCETTTGESTSNNSQASFTGQNAVVGANVQEGDNSSEVSQESKASSGDGVDGQVIGAADSGDGDVNIVAANDCDHCKTTTGDANASNSSISFVGLNALVGVNVQDGDNSAELDQVSWSNTGDGVTGQVIGLVTA